MTGLLGKKKERPKNYGWGSRFWIASWWAKMNWIELLAPTARKRFSRVLFETLLSRFWGLPIKELSQTMNPKPQLITQLCWALNQALILIYGTTKQLQSCFLFFFWKPPIDEWVWTGTKPTYFLELLNCGVRMFSEPKMNWTFSS